MLLDVNMLLGRCDRLTLENGARADRSHKNGISLQVFHLRSSVWYTKSVTFLTNPPMPCSRLYHTLVFLNKEIATIKPPCGRRRSLEAAEETRTALPVTREQQELVEAWIR